MQLPAGASYSVQFGTDDVFVRRVVLVNRATGQRVSSAWDRRGAVPLGDGAKWSLFNCSTRHLVRWNVSDGRVQDLGPAAGIDEGFDCETSPLPASTGKKNVLRPFVAVEPTKTAPEAPLLVDGARARLMPRKKGVSVGLTATPDGDFTFVDGWLFAGQGVCFVGKNAKVRVEAD